MDVAEINLWGELVGAVAWDPRLGYAVFEYDPAFKSLGWDLAPLTMPVLSSRNLYTFPELRMERQAPNDTFKGLPGLLADSLPDRYGNQLINIWLARHGRAQDGMNPVEIDNEGLMSALAELAAQLNELAEIRCSFHCDAPVLLPDNETATQLYRIAQEATTNAIRHAQPEQITISLARVGQQVELRIIDDGRGIAVSDTRPAGMGLQTMVYRARMIRGEVVIHPLPDGGTEVVCSIPVNS